MGLICKTEPGFPIFYLFHGVVKTIPFPKFKKYLILGNGTEKRKSRRLESSAKKKRARGSCLFLVFCRIVTYQYMPPMSGDAGIGGFFSGMSATRDSVVRTMAAV